MLQRSVAASPENTTPTAARSTTLAGLSSDDPFKRHISKSFRAWEASRTATSTAGEANSDECHFVVRI